MTPNKTGFTGITAIAVISAFFSFTSSAQPSADLARFQAKYPGIFMINESVTRDISFELTKKGEPELSFTDYGSLFVLADNSTVLSESKEYFNAKLDVQELKAYSLVPNDDSYKKFPVSNFTKTHEIGDGVFYDDVYSYIFNFPTVGKGTRLVTESKTICRDTFYPIIFYFGSRIPVENSRLTLTLPENVNIIYRLFGYDTTDISFSKTQKGKNITYEWSAGMPKCYIADDESPNARYFTPHIIINIAGYKYKDENIKVLGSLKDIYAWYYSKISKVNTTASPEIKRLADSITAEKTTNREKVRSIYTWVQQNIKYVAFEDGDNGLVPREASQIHQQRYGDCKDKTSLLTAMIKAIGLKSSFAWVGTRKLPYKDSDLPAPSNSNHMIAVWWDDNNQPVLLDGTTQFHGLEQIPSSIQGKQCLIEKGPDDFLLYEIPVSLPAENTSIDSVWISIDNGILKGKGVATITGEEKSDILGSFEGVDSLKYKNLLNKLIPKASNKCNYTAASVSDLKNIDQPVTITYDFELPDYITSNNGSTYVNLNVERFMNDIQLKPDRWIPVELETPFIHRFISILQIPENSVAGNLPETMEYNYPKFNFRQQYSLKGNTVILTTEIMANCQLISGEEFAKFREMLIALNKAYKKSIVLTKK